MKIRGRWRSRWAAAIGVIALLAGGSTLATPAAYAAWDSGQGFVLNNSTVQDRPTYTIRFASSSIESLALPYLQRAVSELHSIANTRITFGGVGSRTGAVDEIYVREATSGSCGTTQWGSWDGCGTYQLSSNYVSSSELLLRASAFNKTATYVHALITHELGHTLGLLHTSDSAQLMHATVDSSDYAASGIYKTGDRNGLRFLARNTPTPPGAPSGEEAPGRLWEAGTSNWNNLASPITGVTDVAAITGSGGRVVYTVRDGRVWEAATASWNNLATPITGVTDVAAINDGGGRVVYTIRDGQVWEAGASTWNNLYTGISGATDLAVISDGGGRVIYTVRDGQLWEAGATSTGWKNLYTGISGVTDIAAISDGGGRVIYTVRSGQVWEASSATWNNLYTGISGVTDVAAITGSGGRVVYTVRDGRVWEAATASWNNLATPITGVTDVAAINDGGGRVVYTIRP